MFCILDVHTQQHRRPVLRFRPTSTSLDVNETVERVGRVVEHAAEFKVSDLLLNRIKIVGNGQQGSIVFFLGGHVKKFVRVLQAGTDTIERQHNVFQHLLFLGEFLRVLGVVPDFRVFEFAGNGA